MRKANYSLSALICIILFVVLFPIQVDAKGPRDGEIVDGSLLSSDKSSSGIYQDMSRGGGNLAFGSSHIANPDNGVLQMDGDAMCFNDMDRLRVIIYLERLRDGEWETVLQRIYTLDNDYFLTGGLRITVDTGYYYRVSGSHIAHQDDYTQEVHTETGGIFFD